MVIYWDGALNSYGQLLLNKDIPVVITFIFYYLAKIQLGVK